MDAYWAGLTPEERAAHDREALAHASPELRAASEGAIPALRRLHLVPIRDAYLRAQLHLS